MIIRTIDDILEVFRERGDRHYGEDVTEREHALQAAEFAVQFGESDAVVLSCLLHDFGHMLHDHGEDIAHRGVDAKHEELGAMLLKDCFPEEILQPVRQHVAAKRYLCWKDPDYCRGLSESSQVSLRLQGGPMSDDQAVEFESLPYFDSCVRVRRYDDLGKVPGMPTESLDSYLPLIEKYFLI